MLYLGGGYRLNMTTANGVTHGYQQVGQTVSGTISTHTLTASATLINAAIAPGSIIQVGAIADEYTVDTVSGTVITTVEALVRTYPAGTHLFLDTVGAWAGVEGYASVATQATLTAQPAFIPNYIGTYPAIEFHSGSKALPFANYSESDNLFGSGGSLVMVFAANSAGASNLGRIIQKASSGGSVAWAVVTELGDSENVKLTFNFTTTGTSAVFTTDAIVPIGETQILIVTYNGLILTTPPVMRLNGRILDINTIASPTGAQTTNAGGIYTIGNRAQADRGFDGRIFDIYLIKHVLRENDCQLMETFLANKYGLTLYDDPYKTYGAREYTIRKPSSPGTYKLLVCLTGGGGTGITFEEQLGINGILGETTVRIYLTPMKNGAGALTWNSGGAQTYNRAPDNIYIPDLISFVKAQLALQGYIIDETYLIGHSNGGMMSYRLMVDNPYMFAGAVIMSADVQVDNPGTYVGRILHFHGLLDENVPLYGGIGLGGVFFTPVQPTVNKFIYAYKDFEVLLTAGHSVSTIKAAIISEQDTTLQQRIADFVLA